LASADGDVLYDARHADRSAAVVVEVADSDSGCPAVDRAGEDVVVVTGATLKYLLRTIKPF